MTFPDDPDQTVSDSPTTDVVRSDGNDNPLRLEYFTVNAPEARRSRSVTIWSLVVLAGWMPYLCGVINGISLRSARATPFNVRASAILMGVGIVMSLLGLISFVRLRHVVGAWFSTLVLAVQVTMAVCAGVAG